MKLFKTLLALFFICNLMAQKLPDEVRFSEDRHFLYTGGNQSKGIFDNSKIHEIKMYFKESNYWNILINNYQTKTNLLGKIIIDGKTLDSVGIRFKGQTSYKGMGGNGANSPKKSFNIELDAFNSSNDVNGYQTINLNNSFQDASFMKEVLYYENIRNHTPAAKASFVHLYINDEDWGIYQAIQQLNKDFLKEWWENNDGTNFRADGTILGLGGFPAWGDGTAALNYLGEDTLQYKKYYTVKSDDIGNAYLHLKNATKLLKETPKDKLDIELSKYFDIDKILWHLASEILFSDDDSYVYKGKMDYYLYRDKNTGQFSTFDYDGNSTFNPNFATWSPFYNESKVNYVLMNKLFGNKKLRQRYIAHMKTLVNEYCDPVRYNKLIDNFHLMIDPIVASDPKKQTSYSEFLNSKSSLKNFLDNRKATIMNNAEFKVESPIISEMTFSGGSLFQNPSENEEALIEVKVSHSSGVSAVNLYHGIDLTGIFNLPIEMNDSGINGDKVANDNIFSAKLPGYPGDTWVRFYAEAIANNNAKSVAYYPVGAEHDVMVYHVESTLSGAKEVVINEFMASNENGPKDEKSQAEDWLELYNTTDKEIDLSNWYLSDTRNTIKKFKIPSGVKIKAKGYLIFWCDEDQMQGSTHTNFKLAADKEVIILSDANGSIVDSTSYTNATKDKSIARIPNGTGPFTNVNNHTFNANNSPNSVNDIDNTIIIFPNPTAEEINIVGKSNENYSIQNLEGKEVMKGISNEGKPIDVSRLNSGLYIIKIKNQTLKFSKL